jgi:hypothetical protein
MCYKMSLSRVLSISTKLIYLICLYINIDRVVIITYDIIILNDGSENIHSRITDASIQIDSWQIGNFIHDKQFDGVSCDLLCLLFLESLVIDNKSLNFNSEMLSIQRKNYYQLLKDHKN